MKINNLQALKAQQGTLKKELSEIESIVSFKKPIKSIQFFSKDLFNQNKETKEKNLAKVENQPIAKHLISYAKTHLEQTELLDELFQNGIHKASLFIFNKYLNQKIKTSWKKKIISSLLTFLLPILIKYLYEALKNKNKHEF